MMTVYSRQSGRNAVASLAVRPCAERTGASAGRTGKSRKPPYGKDSRAAASDRGRDGASAQKLCKHFLSGVQSFTVFRADYKSVGLHEAGNES